MELVTSGEIPRKILAGQKEFREPNGGQPGLLCANTCLTNNKPHTECLLPLHCIKGTARRYHYEPGSWSSSDKNLTVS